MLYRRRIVIIGVIIAAAALLAVAASRLRQGDRGGVPAAEQRFQSGLALARSGQGSQAVAEWNLAIALDPADPRPYEALVEYWETQERPDQAVQVLERLAVANPSAPHRDCRLARAAFAAGWVTRASEAADRAVREEPECPLAHTLRGIVLEDAGEREAALEELATAHRLDPHDTRIALSLAQAEGRAERRLAALARVRQVLQREPELPLAHYLMGWLLAHASPRTPATDAEAVRHLQQVLKHDPGHAGSLGELGALYVRQKEFARARPLLEGARRRNPRDPDLTRNLALTLAGLGDPRASGLKAEARRLEEQQQRRRDLRGRHRRDPEDHDSALQLARLELAAGQTGEALDLARRILRADPNHRGALDLMHQLIGTPPAAPSLEPPGRP